MKHDQPPLSAAEASQCDLELLGLDRGAVEVGDVDAVGADRDDLVLADRQRAPRVRDERGDVRAQEVLAVAEADHERRVAAGADDDAGLVGVHASSVNAPSRRCDGLRMRSVRSPVLAVLAGDEVRGDLGVGLARGT